MRRKPSGPCIYCGSAPAAEWEHVFPDSWYPDWMAPSKRLQVPSCGACNDAWEKVERELAKGVLMGVDPRPRAIQGVVDRFIRGLQVEHGRDPRDRRKRGEKAAAFMRTMKYVPPVMGEVQVHVQMRSGLILRRSPAREVPASCRHRFAEKLIRGFHYAETEEILGPLTVMAFMGKSTASDMRKPELADAWKELDRLPTHSRFAPAISYRRLRTPGVTAWAFDLWEQVVIVAFARPGTDAFA